MAVCSLTRTNDAGRGSMAVTLPVSIQRKKEKKKKIRKLKKQNKTKRGLELTFPRSGILHGWAATERRGLPTRLSGGGGGGGRRRSRRNRNGRAVTVFFVLHGGRAQKPGQLD